MITTININVTIPSYSFSVELPTYYISATLPIYAGYIYTCDSSTITCDNSITVDSM
jgi:hypothetical protein